MTKYPHRVVQIIDSLNAGGSERMAVHLANKLSDRVEFSAIVSTRKSGLLENQIHKNVFFLCLHRKFRFDVSAISRLHRFIKKNRIGIIHAHGTSFFVASVIKLFLPGLKLVWHDHYGFRYKTKIWHNKALYMCAFYFNHIICINNNLKNWANQNLNCKKITCLQNFSTIPQQKEFAINKLKGDKNEFKIIHLANLRPEKDHITALKAVAILKEKGFNISYHCLGAINFDDYFQNIKAVIKENALENQVHFYNSQPDIFNYLKNADLGILSSTSEGYPVSLIEYALAEIPVVVTDVGDCKKIVGDFAHVATPGDYQDISKAIEKHISDNTLSLKQAKQLNARVVKTTNPESIINKIMDIYSA